MIDGEGMVFILWGVELRNHLSAVLFRGRIRRES